MSTKHDSIKRKMFNNEPVVKPQPERPQYEKLKPKDIESLINSERIKEIKKKELQKYREAQDKKWDNWKEAMSK